MTGKLIRCLCGTMYDPDRYQTCPECGRPPMAPGTPHRTVPAPPAELPASPPTAPVAPRWLWLGGVVVLGVLVLAFALKLWREGGESGPAPPLTDAREGTRSVSGPERCTAVAGDWSWFTGGFVHFSDDGRAFFKPTEDAPPALTASWTCDPDESRYTVVWSHGFTDTLRLYDDDQVIQGTSNTGVDVSGKRYVDPARGLPPLHTVSVGSQQIPARLPALAQTAARVAADWRPDAYLVSLKIRKDGWPNKDAFYVQMSFYSPSEGTGLWVSTHLTRSKVRDAGTVSWSAQPIPDAFIDLPEAVKIAQQAGMRGRVSRAELRVNQRRGDKASLVWSISPEQHGEGVGLIDAQSGRILSVDENAAQDYIDDYNRQWGRIAR